MRTIAIVDTSICTDNLGDEIIMAAVDDAIGSMFTDAYVFRVPSHEGLSDRTRSFLRQSSYCFIGGTNLLSSDLTAHGLWRLDAAAAEAFGDTRTVCLGTGWNDYMEAANPKTRAVLRTVLSGAHVHSVRDGYTRDHLREVGLQAVNTSCPTTWSLTPERCAVIPRARASAAVFTLSAWRRDVEADRQFIALLKRHYAKLFFFPQMQDDFAYFHEFGLEDVALAGTTVAAYDRFLENADVDFVGTRLHGGIRALQKGRRALILSIDNRATEIARTTGLPVAGRGDSEAIAQWIEGGAATEIVLPQADIDAWKAQFEPARLEAAPKPRAEPAPRGRTTRALSALRKKVAGGG